MSPHPLFDSQNHKDVSFFAIASPAVTTGALVISPLKWHGSPRGHGDRSIPPPTFGSNLSSFRGRHFCTFVMEEEVCRPFSLPNPTRVLCSTAHISCRIITAVEDGTIQLPSKAFAEYPPNFCLHRRFLFISAT